MKHAFSLVELSIVLVILGLLVGGILAGQSLIRAAELRSVTTEYNRFITASQSFRDKYFAIPGDMTNAQSFWGVAHATAATCVTTAGTGTQTCNGNGDGYLVPSAGSNENFRFWQHLTNAGLIEGSYDGITHGSTAYSGTAANSPTSKLSGGLWFVYYYPSLSGSSFYFDAQYGNFFNLGTIQANSSPTGPILKPEEQWNIDTKMDDGKPATGTLMAIATVLNACTTTSSSANLAADYLLTNNAVACTLLFRRLF